MERVQPETSLPKTKVYNTYTALLNQVETDAPTATILQNNLGAPIVWTREGTGYYKGTLSNAFPENKTFILIGQTDYTAVGLITASRLDDNAVYIDTYDTAFALADDTLSNTAIEIRIYNQT